MQIKRMANQIRQVGAVLTGVAVLLTLSGAAHADSDLFTAPLFLNNGDSALYCSVLNVSSTPKTVTIQVKTINGVLVGSAQTFTDLPPGTGGAHGEATGIGSAYCQFTLAGHAKTTTIRAVGQALTFDGTSLTTSTAVPAD